MKRLTHLVRRGVVTMLAASGLMLGMTGISQASGVTVTDLNNGATAKGMAESLAGGGVSISNVTYTGDNRAGGTFTGGAGSIGFENGILLDSGKVQTYTTDPACSQGVEGPNTCGHNTTAFGTPGDAELSVLSGHPTFDASILEFDFVPEFSTAEFSYVFSSEEYNEFVNSPFNDVFGFFVNGSNCALVPGTSEPVTINTINNGSHKEFYRDNESGSIDSQMDGLTTVLTCKATVNSGQTNHIKLAIADASDNVLDSAVFIQSGSLISGTQIKTSLSGGGQSGENITVPPGTAVTDNATLSGANASKATGTVNYKVYSDNECTKEVASAGTVTVTGGVVPPSNPETLSTGTYYWQASYSGDSLNNPSTSKCGSEIETVEPEKCTTVIGSGQFRPSGEVQTVDNEVTTTGSKHVFEYAWGTRTNHLRLVKLTEATCFSSGTESKFKGRGTATVNGVKGYEITFTFTIAGGKTNLVLVLEKGGVVVRTFTDEPLIVTKLQRERIF